MTGFSPPPPPQAARAIVRQLFSLRGSSPRVSATALEEHDTHESSIEFLNEGSQADNVRCLVRVAFGATTTKKSRASAWSVQDPDDLHALASCRRDYAPL